MGDPSPARPLMLAGTVDAERRGTVGSVRGGGLLERDLIKRAVRVGPPGAAIDEVDPEHEQVDWQRLVDLARAHGVLALVARSLKSRGWPGVPAEVVQTLVDYRAALAARNLFLTRQLLGLVDLLASHGITALPYKGPLLAAYAYGDVGMRPFNDLDLVLAEGDVLRARSLLISHGYQSLSPRTDSERPGELPPGYAVALRRADEQVLVELHWRLAPSCPLTVDGLLRDIRAFTLLGSDVPCLGPEQFLLALCVHGAKHAWERLEWVCGVAHLIGRRPDLDWARVEADAEAVGARRSVALGAALAVGVCAAPVPGGAMRALGATAVRSLAGEVEARVLRQAPRSGDPVARHWARLRAGSARDRLRYLLFLRLPTEKDRAVVALPGRLSFLYFLVRPLRVVCEHARRDRGGRWRDRAARRQAERALARQLEHQEQKAAALRGRDDEVVAALALRWERMQRRLRRFRPEGGGQRLLEVGSGAHGILFGSGSSLSVGVDPLALHYAGLFPVWQRSIPTVAGVGERLPFGDAAFDVVVCDNVVDHCEQPAAVVAELVRVLAPGGLLYFTVNVHHRLYSVLARAHRAWNAAGIPLEIGPFADHTVHLTPVQARDLFDGLPLEVRRERVYLGEAKERARRRRLRHPGDLLPLVLFKNARFEVIAQRV
jgi:SAM-dependent methyltransferase